MSEQSPSVRALQITTVSFVLSATFEVLKHVFFRHISLAQSHVATILFFTSLMFFLSRAVIRREREFRNANKEREEFANAIIQNLPVLLCIFDSDGNFLRWNPQFESKLGYSREDISKFRILDTIAEEDRERLKQTMGARFGREAVETEACLLHRNGTKIPFYMTGTRIVFQGKACILAMAMDNSAQKKRQAQLRLQATALRAAANGIVITRHDGTIEWVNPAFTKMTGFTMKEAIGNNPRLLKSERHDKDFYHDLWSTISVGKVWEGEVTNRRKDGSFYTEEMTITPVVSNHGTITHYIAIKHDISARKQAEEALQRAEEQYRSIFDEAIIGIFRSTPDGRFLMMNPAMAKMLRCDSPEQALDKIPEISALYGDPAQRRELLTRLEQNGALKNVEHEFRRDGTELWFSMNLRCIYNDDGTPAYYEGTAEDVTERKLLERQLRQAQKMEAVGRLAGGIAHDFNNALGVIVGYTALLKESLSLDTTALRYAEQIGIAGNRAASLTRQLLAFSRKQVVQPTIVNLNAVVTETEKMLRRLIGEDIDLVLLLDPHLGRVRADLAQIDQILMNLAVNARDAMPQGGRLVIQTSNAELDGTNLSRHEYAKPGRYVMLSVSDTGCGMNRQTQAHIFDPFFTTKDTGKGTGLGLSTVYGIVKQSEGYVWVYSEPGQGATFKIYLPQVNAAAEPIPAAETEDIPKGSETILLVEDDDSMRDLTRHCLEMGGYAVLGVQDGEAAIRIASERKVPIHLLLTDVVMPGINGRQLAESLSVLRPNLRVLYMSGYTADLVAQRGVLEPQVALLEKPFTREALFRKVRTVLDGSQFARTAVAP